MKTTRIATFAFSLCLLTLAGCGRMVELEQVPHKDAGNWRTFSPADYGIEQVIGEDGSISYTWSQDATMEQDLNVLPYWKNKGALLNDNAVKGLLNDEPYPVIFDTGCNPMLIISERLVTENDLPVFFFKPNSIHSSSALAMADSLKIGSFELTNYPCGLWEHKAEYSMLGVTVHQPEMIIIPLDMMRQFSYFKFDDRKHKISFASEAPFEPENESEWLSWPFRIEGLHLLLDLSIEGIDITLMLDTGAGYQLELDESIVKQLLRKQPDFEDAPTKTVHLYSPYDDGKKAVTRMTVKKIHLSNYPLNSVKLYYGSQPYDTRPYKGVIGSELFKKTVMVLDFKNNLLWVQKVKGSRFEETE